MTSPAMTPRVDSRSSQHALAPRARTAQVAETEKTTPRLHNPLNRITYSIRGATWRSGYATVCKTVYPGSIPGVASTISELARANPLPRDFTLCNRAPLCYRRDG